MKNAADSIYDFRASIVTLSNGNFKVIPFFAGEEARGAQRLKVSRTNGFQVAGDTSKSHIENVQSIARAYFGGGMLKRGDSTELPTAALAAWGFSRATTPRGEVSVAVTHYYVQH